jgi:hypothetical protein
MRKILRFWKVIILDILGVAFMLAGLLTGWLPGPGGIPLFIIGLSLLAVNHEWAERYIDLLKKHANHLGEFIFVSNPRIQQAYDILAPIVISVGIFMLIRHSALWMVSLGIFATFMGITFLLGNRHRYKRIKKKLLKK